MGGEGREEEREGREGGEEGRKGREGEMVFANRLCRQREGGRAADSPALWNAKG